MMEKTAVGILKILKNNDFKSYFVGGYVRDKFLHRNTNDIDIATSATPEEIIDVFIDYTNITIVPTGIKHGTLTLVHDSGISTEVTSFRKDISCDGRNATVEFTTDIEADLSRRDFTINSLAYCPIDDKLIDPYDGFKDIQNRLIRAVGNPVDRFREDYLRLFRALRFEANLNFHIEDKTWDDLCVVANEDFSSKLSIERVRDELNKCFKVADCPSDMIDNMYECGLLKKYIPELHICNGFQQNKYHKHDVYWHTLCALDAVPAEFPLIRWAALFHDLGKPISCENYGTPEASFHNHEKYSEEIAIDIMKRFKFSNDDIVYISNLVRHHMFKCTNEMKNSAIRRFVSSLGVENVDAICILKYADRVGNGKKVAEEMDIDSTGLKKRFAEILHKDACFKIKDLTINGNDIMTEFGLESGPSIGKLLKYCFEIVLENPNLNQKDLLIQQVNYLIFKGDF